MKLGKLLLQGLRPGRRKPSKRRGPAPRTSSKSPKARLHLKFRKPKPPRSEPSVQAPALPAAPAPAPPVVFLPEPVHSVQPLPPPPARTLSARQFIRPDAELQQSIEAFLLDQRSEHTRRAYGKDLKRFLKFLLLRADLEKLDRRTLISYKDHLLSENLERTTVDRHLATLRSFFKWLVDDGRIDRSPAEGVRFLNPRKLSTTQGFTDEEVRRVLTLPDLHTRVGSQHYAVLMVLFYCGLRRSELCSLRTSQIFTERGQRLLRLRGKGDAERIVILIDPVWNALKHHFLITRRDVQADQWLFAPIRNNRTGETDKPLDPSMIFYIVRKYARLAGIQSRVSPHSCRATAISNARDHGVPDRAIQEFAGWASPDMITRYDKRKGLIEGAAGRAIQYGTEEAGGRPLPWVPKPTDPE